MGDEPERLAIPQQRSDGATAVPSSSAGAPRVSSSRPPRHMPPAAWGRPTARASASRRLWDGATLSPTTRSATSRRGDRSSRLARTPARTSRRGVVPEKGGTRGRDREQEPCERRTRERHRERRYGQCVDRPAPLVPGHRDQAGGHGQDDELASGQRRGSAATAYPARTAAMTTRERGLPLGRVRTRWTRGRDGGTSPRPPPPQRTRVAQRGCRGTTCRQPTASSAADSLVCPRRQTRRAVSRNAPPTARSAKAYQRQFLHDCRSLATRASTERSTLGRNRTRVPTQAVTEDRGVVARSEHHRGARTRPARDSATAKPSPSGSLDVEEDQLGFELRREPNGFDRARGLADHHEVVR